MKSFFQRARAPQPQPPPPPPSSTPPFRPTTHALDIITPHPSPNHFVPPNYPSGPNGRDSQHSAPLSPLLHGPFRGTSMMTRRTSTRDSESYAATSEYDETASTFDFGAMLYRNAAGHVVGPPPDAFDSLLSHPMLVSAAAAAVPARPISSRRSGIPAPPPSARLGSQRAYAHLQLGIQHHEANRLEESAACFERSAKEDGGCAVGMLMWGLALRHGWGCPKDEASGYKWLRKAAETAVEGLERVEGQKDAHIVQDELVIAIYEVGQCFFQGWGVQKDKKMAVSYYTTAAKLGDADAQADLAFCLANGKGCKKDRKEAAKWYRAAVAQGVSDVGLAWIYKEKFK